MPIMKITFIYSQDDQGWSESYCTVGASPDPGAYLPEAQQVGQAGMALRGNNTFWEYTRITSVDTLRATFLNHNTPFIRGNPGQESDTPNTCLNLGFKNATRTKTKNTFMRGIWDSSVTLGGEFQPTPAYKALFTVWLNLIKQKGWGWLGVNIKTFSPLATLVQDAAGTISGTVVNPLWLNNEIGQRRPVRFSLLSQPGNLNGANPIEITAINGFVTLKRIAMLPYTGGGRLTQATKQVIPIDIMNFGTIGERKAGRIFAAARGRAPARKRA